MTKNVVTGEGGMVLAKNEKDIARIKILALHGMSRDAWQRFSDQGYKHYFVTEAGFKYNMMDIQAAIGIHQLKRVEKNWQRRKEIWQKYIEALAGLPIGLPAPEEPNTRHAYHLFTVLVDQERSGISRDDFLGAMTREGIGMGVHYLSVPEHPYYQKTFGWSKADYPWAFKIGRETVSLPLSAKLTNEEVSRIIQAARKILAKK